MPTLAHFVDDLTNVTNGKDDYARDNNIEMFNVNAAHFHLSFTLCKCWRYDNRIIPTVIITVDFALELCIYTVRVCDNEELHYQVIIQQHRSSSKENISRKKKQINKICRFSSLFKSKRVSHLFTLCALICDFPKIGARVQSAVHYYHIDCRRWTQNRKKK